MLIPLSHLGCPSLPYSPRCLPSLVVVQASLLIRFGDASVAEAFLASRLDFSHLFNYGTLGLPLTTCANIIQRNMPRPAEDDEDHHTGGKL